MNAVFVSQRLLTDITTGIASSDGDDMLFRQLSVRRALASCLVFRGDMVANCLTPLFDHVSHVGRLIPEE